jgi:putative DNA primase/helicase
MISPLEAAQELREWGLCVLPAVFQKKMPSVPWKGRTELPTESELEDWFGKVSVSSYWILCGQVSRLAVFDADNKAAIEWARAEIGPEILDSTPCVKTAKGMHWYFRLDEDEIVPSWSRHDLGADQNGGGAVAFDLRSEGAGVIAPPSIHQTGIVYKWVRTPAEGLQALPAVLRRVEDVQGGGGAENGAAAAPKGPAKDTLAGLLSKPAIEGGRNSWLTKVCGHLAKQHTFKDGYLANVHLANRSLKPPLSGEEVEKTAESIWSAEHRAMVPAQYIPRELTESGAAHVFAEKRAGQLWYSGSAGWLVYNEDEGRFRADEDEALLLMQRTMSSLRAEAVQRDDKKAITFGTAVTSARGLRAILSLAQLEPTLRAEDKEFDAHPHLLNVRNGVLDLDQGTLLAHAAELKFTRRAGVEWQEGADCPRWKAHLDRIFEGDQALIDFMQRWAGRALSGVSQSDNCRILMPYGTGANGKTVTVETLSVLLGDYAKSSDFQTWCASKEGGGSAQRQDLVDLAGVRLVTATESGYHHSLDEALLKAYTGGERVSPRGMYARQAKVYTPHFSLLLSTNHLPRLEGSDRGFWRRFLKIGFTVEIPEPDQDHQLLAKLREELPGILLWALQGYQAWAADGRGLDPPTSVLMETAQYKCDIDWVGQFVEQTMRPCQGTITSLRLVYNRYRTWCSECGIQHPLTEQQFGARLVEHGIEKVTNQVSRRGDLVNWELADGRTNGDGQTWLAGPKEEEGT